MRLKHDSDKWRIHRLLCGFTGRRGQRRVALVAAEPLLLLRKLTAGRKEALGPIDADVLSVVASRELPRLLHGWRQSCFFLHFLGGVAARVLAALPLAPSRPETS